jgi:hypothetical protein
MRMRALPGIVLATVLLLGADTAVRAAGKGSTSDFGRVEFGPKELQFVDGCAQVDGHLTSGNFFDDLKRTDVRGRFEFTKRGVEVSDYPESVTSEIRLIGSPCLSALSNGPASVFGGQAYALTFQVQWKSGMQLRPAALASTTAKCDGFSSVVLPGGDTVPTIVCQLTVDSRGVPLADHLIVSVFSPDGTRLTRLSAAP